MKSKATTVAAYLKGLPADRRTSLAAVRKLILRNLPKGDEEVLERGMISDLVPLPMADSVAFAEKIASRSK